MRKEPFFINDYVHVYNRGNRRQEIVRDDLDRLHFVRALYYLNSENVPSGPFQSLRRSGWFKQYSGLNNFAWPPSWEPRQEIVKIVAYILRDNHYHLLLQEIKEGGISRFMKKVSNSMTNRFNIKYNEVGSIFQGAYKARRVESDNYLRYLSVYIQVKNALEIFPGGMESAHENFVSAYNFALKYPYSSLSNFVNRSSGNKFSVIEPDSLSFMAFEDADSFRNFACNTIPRVIFEEKGCRLAIE